MVSPQPCFSHQVAPSSLQGRQVLYAASGDDRGGTAMVIQLLAAGAQVLAVSRDSKYLSELTSSSQQQGTSDRLTTLQADVARPLEAARAVAAAQENGLELSVVIANLGEQVHHKPFEQVVAQDWEALNWSLQANVVLAQTAIPILRHHDHALYLVLNDAAALDPRPSASVMTTAAAGELILTKSLAFETAGHPIVHGLVVVNTTGCAGSLAHDFITNDSVGEVVVGLLERPDAARDQVIFSSGWRDHLDPNRGAEATNCL